LFNTITTNSFSAIKETEQLFIIRQQRKATREAIRLNELVAYAIPVTKMHTSSKLGVLTCEQGWKMASKNIGFAAFIKKTPKPQKSKFYVYRPKGVLKKYFVVKFYTDYI